MGHVLTALGPMSFAHIGFLLLILLKLDFSVECRKNQFYREKKQCWLGINPHKYKWDEGMFFN